MLHGHRLGAADGATLRPDQIVEMCDEMIAAYGDELPPLPARTLVPTSGKTFPKVDSRVLRASWDQVQASAKTHHLAKNSQGNP